MASKELAPQGCQHKSASSDADCGLYRHKQLQMVLVRTHAISMAAWSTSPIRLRAQAKASRSRSIGQCLSLMGPPLAQAPSSRSVACWGLGYLHEVVANLSVFVKRDLFASKTFMRSSKSSAFQAC